LLKEYEGEVSLVFRHFPLRQIHTNANLPSQATEAAGSQGKFWEMHDMIFEGQNVWSDQSQSKAKDTFVGYAQKINLDIERFERDMDSDEVKDAIEKDYQSGLRSQVDSTPTFFLNRQKIQPTNYENFKSIIDQAVAERSS